MGKKIKKAKPIKEKRAKVTLRAMTVGEGLRTVTKMHEELLDMKDVLMGRTAPPAGISMDSTLALMEVADMYFARAAEMTMEIQGKEREGKVGKGDPLYQFRTGELRTFMELAKRASDLGSRRLTEETLVFKKTVTGRESAGGF